MKKFDPNQINTVVCGTDLSNNAKDALAIAAEIAQAFSARLLIVHAIETWDSRYDFLVKDLSKMLTLEAKAQLQTELKHLGKTKAVPVEVIVRKGKPLKVILDVVKKREASLVVVGRKGLGDDPDENLGSTPGHLIQACPTSVLIVKPSPPKNIKRIVCSMDFSECSKTGLDWAIALAKKERVKEISVINTFEVPRGYMEAGMTFEVAEERMRKVHEKDAKKMLKKRRSCPIEIKSFIEEGRPCDTIIKFSKKRKADLIIIGTQGRSKITALLVGSNAVKLLRKSQCCILAVKSKQHFLTLLGALDRI